MTDEILDSEFKNMFCWTAAFENFLKNWIDRINTRNRKQHWENYGRERQIQIGTSAENVPASIPMNPVNNAQPRSDEITNNIQEDLESAT